MHADKRCEYKQYGCQGYDAYWLHDNGHQHKECRQPSCHHVESSSPCATRIYHQCVLSVGTVNIAVTEIVYQQKGVNHHTTGNGGNHNVCWQRNTCSQIISAAYRHYAKEQDNKHIAHGMIGEPKCIEETPCNARYADKNEIDVAIAKNGQQTYDAGKCRCGDNGIAHGPWGYPSFSASSGWTQPCSRTVVTVEIVEIVVYKVCVNLHDYGKEKAEQ